MTLSGGNQLVAIVTMESVKNLGIVVGKEAIALVTATAVIKASHIILGVPA